MDGYGTKSTTPFNGQIRVESGYSSGFTGVRIKFESEPYQAEENDANQGYVQRGDNVNQSYSSYPQNNTYQQVHEQEFGVKNGQNSSRVLPGQPSSDYYNEFNSENFTGLDTVKKEPLATPKKASKDGKKSQPTPASGAPSPNGHHECEICHKVFSSNPSLRRHREIHSGQKKFSCELCGNCYTQKHNLTKHMRVHTGEKPYKCDKCDKSFYVHHHLKNHELQHTGQYPYSCDTCNRGFKHKVRLREHEKTHHSGEGSTAQSPPSVVTSEDNSTSEVWDERETTENGEEYDEMETVEEMDDAAMELLDDLFDEDRKYNEHECEVCQQIFIDQASLDKHMKGHVAEREFKCDDCSSIFLTRAHLMRHRKVHTGETLYECEECNVSFRFKVSLHIHMRRHNNDYRRYECTKCNKYFLSKESLKKHMNIHSGLTSYQCEECSEKFTQKADYKAHCKSHSEIVVAEPKDRAQPTCKICSKTFSSNSSLRKHEFTHMDVKPHKCDLCNVSFAQKIQLRLHNKRHNDGVMPPPDQPVPTIRIKEVVPSPEKQSNNGDTSVETEEKKPVCVKIVIPEKRTSPQRTRKAKEVKEETEPEDEQEDEDDEEEAEAEEDEDEEEEENMEEKEKVDEAGSEKKKSRWEGYRYPVCPNCNMRFKKGLALRRHARKCKKKNPL